MEDAKWPSTVGFTHIIRLDADYVDHLMVLYVSGVPERIATSDTFFDFRMVDRDAKRLIENATQAILGRLLAQKILKEECTWEM